MEPRILKNEATGRAVLSISGMTCAGCANTVTRLLSRIPGVTGAKVDFGSGLATVWGRAHPEELIATVEAAGYGAQLSQRNSAASGERDEHDGSGCC